MNAMLLPKSTIIRSKRIREFARNAPCMICGSEGTTVAAHYGSERGMGIKATDTAVAYLCQLHHDEVDGRSGGLTKLEQRELFLRAYVRTVRYWFDNGIVRFA